MSESADLQALSFRMRELAEAGSAPDAFRCLFRALHQIAPRGALLLVSDVPITPDGVKTEESDRKVTENWVNLHLQVGIEAMTDLGKKGEMIKHFTY